MARVYPAMEQLRHLPVPLQAGELQVLDTLQVLDDDWAIYVQPRLGLDQPDFVVVHPEHGVVVLEVRDWRPGMYRLSPSGLIETRFTGSWERTDEAPRYVAHRTAVVVQERFFADTNDPPRDPSIRAMVVLVRQSAQETQELVGTPRVTQSELRVRCLSGAELRVATLDEMIGQVRMPRRPVSSRNLARLVRHLDQSVAVDAPGAPDPSASGVGPDPGGLHPDGLAVRLAAGPPAGTRPVRGAAGTGKTTGLVARATELARQGRDVLVVTGTPHHAGHLHSQIVDRCRTVGADPRRVSCIHVIGLCARAADDARVAGVRRSAGPRRRMAIDAHELAERAVHAYQSGLGPRFDDVLVDQGEDLTTLQWSLLRLLVRRDEDDGELLLVTDPSQQLEGLPPWVDPGNAEAVGLLVSWIESHETHRLPADLVALVADYADSYLGDDVVPPEPISAGGAGSRSERRWIDAPPGAAIGRLLGEEVLRLLDEVPGLRADDVLFIAPSHRAGTDATMTIRAAGHEVQHVFGSDSRDGQRRRERFRIGAPGVKGCTAAEAKGLEARAVVVAIPPTRHGRVWGYIGLTRVRAEEGRRSFVTVVNQDVALRGFGRLFASRPPAVAATPAPVPAAGAAAGPAAGTAAGTTAGTTAGPGAAAATASAVASAARSTVAAPVGPAPAGPAPAEGTPTLWRRAARVLDTPATGADDPAAGT